MLAAPGDMNLPTVRPVIALKSAQWLEVGRRAFPAIALVLLCVRAGAQDLEPRAYSASPVGTQFLVLVYGRTGGQIVFDPTIPITDAEARLNTPAVGVGGSIGLLGRQALVTAALPYVWGKAEGSVGEARSEIRRSGLANLQTRFAINLHGSPALSPQEFAKRRRRWIVGTSVTVHAPTGQYSRTKLINIGTNRWAVKPEVGLSIPLKRFDIDAYLGAWFFETNNAVFPGDSVRKQDSLRTVQAHVSYTIRRGLWLAFDSTWYGGGASSVDGGPKSLRQNSTRIGATFSLPIGQRQSLKFGYGNGVSARAGSDFDTFSVAWQVIRINQE